MLFLSPLLIPISRRRKKAACFMEKRLLTEEFQEMLGYLVTELRAGFSPENAFRQIYDSLCYTHGRDSLICRELLCIRAGMENHIPLERLLREFGEKYEVEVIRDFAEVFAIARRSGGNMTEIMERTAETISRGIASEAETDLLLHGRKTEQKIMNLIPFLITFYIEWTSRGFFGILYHNPAGIAMMTACMFSYLGAYVLSEKILAIHFY